MQPLASRLDHDGVVNEHVKSKRFMNLPGSAGLGAMQHHWMLHSKAVCTKANSSYPLTFMYGMYQPSLLASTNHLGSIQAIHWAMNLMLRLNQGRYATSHHDECPKYDGSRRRPQQLRTVLGAGVR